MHLGEVQSLSAFHSDLSISNYKKNSKDMYTLCAIH